MSTAATAATLAPEWLAHRYDPGHDAIHFVEADRATRRAASFLTDEHLPGASAAVVVRRADAIAAMPAARARMNFVFHSAYCCSTLVANAYDRPGAAFGLKEPVLLNDLVGWRHRGAPPARVGEVLDDALTLLARPFEGDKACVIKPSNVVNGLAPAMVAARPAAGVLLLHAPLEVYLGSIAGKGLTGRLWVRDLYAKLLTDGLVAFGFEPREHLLHTDLQVAAIGWLAQHALFAKVARSWPDRVRTLDSEVLLARPGEALAALDALFGVAGDDASRAEIVASVFNRHAKFGTAFSAEDRRAGQVRAASAYQEEIDQVAAWARVVAERFGVTMDLPERLLGSR